jgi:hypothetical protein
VILYLFRSDIVGTALCPVRGNALVNKGIPNVSASQLCRYEWLCMPPPEVAITTQVGHVRQRQRVCFRTRKCRRIVEGMKPFRNIFSGLQVEKAPPAHSATVQCRSHLLGYIYSSHGTDQPGLGIPGGLQRREVPSRRSVDARRGC